MLNNLKTLILTKLEERNIKSEVLDKMLRKPRGYSLWMIENSDITRFPFNDEAVLAFFLGMSIMQISKLSGKDAYEKNNKYIRTLTTTLYEEVKETDIQEWESHEGKLSIYLRSCDLPGNVRDTEIRRIEGEEYEIEPATDHSVQYYAAGPVYIKKVSDEFTVLITKSYAEKMDEETLEIAHPMLCGIYLTDNEGHLVDYLEVESESAFSLRLHKSYVELSKLYDILHEFFGDEDYYSFD